MFRLFVSIWMFTSWFFFFFFFFFFCLFTFNFFKSECVGSILFSVLKFTFIFAFDLNGWFAFSFVIKNSLQTITGELLNNFTICQKYFNHNEHS